MINPVRVAHVEHDLHLRKERRRDAFIAVIGPCIEGEPIGAGRDWQPLGQCVHASLAVGRAASNPAPLACLAHLEDDGHPDSRSAAGSIQNVSCNHVVFSAKALPRRTRWDSRCMYGGNGSSSCKLTPWPPLAL